MIRLKHLQGIENQNIQPISSQSLNFGTPDPARRGDLLRDTAELLSPAELSKMVHQTGFEPVTFALEGRCSIQLSYWCTSFPFYAKKQQQFKLYIIERPEI